MLDTGGVPIDDFIFTMRGVTGNELTMLQTNDGTFNAQRQRRRGARAQRPWTMFQAVKHDKLARVRLRQPRGALRPASDGRR